MSMKQANETVKRTTPVLLVLATAFAGAGMLLTACNTVEGAGRDVEAVGDSIADTASDAKD